MKRRRVKGVPFFPFIPIVPAALLVGTMATAVRALIRVRRLESRLPSEAVPTPA